MWLYCGPTYRERGALGVPEIIGVDPDADAREAALDAGATVTYTSLESALEEQSVDFGIVSVPNHLHVPVARRLSEAGADLLIEKPLSHQTDGVAELANQVDRRDLVTMVGCNLRFHPALRRLRTLLDDGRIDDPVTVQIAAGSYLPDWHPDDDYRTMYSANLEIGGGAILDFIHEINYARWLLDEIDTVSAMTASQSHLDIDTEDVGAMILQTTGDTLCEIHVDYVRPDRRRV